MKKTHVVAVTMGDPAGIGPEIIVKSLSSPHLLTSPVVVIGDRRIMERACEICGVELSIHTVQMSGQGMKEIVPAPGVLYLLDLNNVDLRSFKSGVVSAECGRAAYEYIEKSVELALNRHVDAVATAPISKESIKAAGIDHIGHTEMFASLTGTLDPLTMFEVKGMRVFFLTRHVPLRQACVLVTEERILDYVPRCTMALRRLGISDGTMAIAGLNPHSGEHGLFGDEEMRAIVPAVKKLQDAGYDVVGPVPADSVFSQTLRGRYNSVLSLYHDQGHIACKTLDFDRTVAITNGMPILRTSVDHGTAFDIAGTGAASEVSMIEAILAAEKYSKYFAG